MDKYLDKNLSPKERAEDLLSKLSLEEKMAQLNCVFPLIQMMKGPRQPMAIGMFKKDAVHGVGSFSCFEVRNIPTTSECLSYLTDCQKMIMEASEHNIPTFIHMEGVCGGYVQGSTSFPSNINRGASFDPKLEREIGEIVARQETACGVSQILAPVLDVNRDPRMGRQAESYGEDPALASALGSAFTAGIQGYARPDGFKADAMAKHFLAFHNSLGGIHAAESQTSPRLLREVYGKPFQAAIKEANLKAVMPSYCSMDGQATSLNKELLTDLLREEMGFDGLAATDYSALDNAYNVDKIGNCAAEVGYRAMQAGMDLEWPRKQCYDDELLQWFRDGKADVSVLDEKVLRVLERKFATGLFDHPFPLEGEEFEKEFHHDDDDNVAKRSAEEGIIMLKNDGVLPLKKDIKKIAVIGYHAGTARSYFGGYSHISMAESTLARMNSIAGVDPATHKTIYKEFEKYPGTKVQVDTDPSFDKLVERIHPEVVNLYEQIKKDFPNVEVVYAYGYPFCGNDESHFDEALEAIKTADVAILTLGGKYSSGSFSTMGEGIDSTNVNLPICQDDFIKKAKELNVPLIGVHFDGRPISSDVADANLSAILEAFAPGEMGGVAISNIIKGTVNPSGKLPVSIVYNAGQAPLFYNHPNGSGTHQSQSIGFSDYVDCPHTPRYPFGFGLSYTKFEYANLQLNKKEIGPDEAVEISFDVTNAGEYDGTEVAQVYLTDERASMIRPNMELVAFDRVSLKKGETKKVRFLLNASQTAFLDLDMNWLIEKGTFTVKVGKSSNEIVLTDAFDVTENKIVTSRERAYYCLAE